MTKMHSILHQQISLFSDHKILIVDDAVLNRELIASYLYGAGFKNIEQAEDGIDALEKIKTFEPDLLILDLIMPNMTGIEVIKHVRADLKFSQLPIIVQTSITTPEERMDAWGYGATDVITKPIHKLELLSRVKVQLENSFLIKELETYQTMAMADISQALEVQNSILPSPELIEEIEQTKNIKLDSIFIPSRFLSGDMWGLINTDDQNLSIWICDFAGKGIQAALNTFRIHTLIQELKPNVTNPSLMIKMLNERLVDMMSVGQFATFFYGVIDQSQDKLLYAAASSTHPIIYYPAQQTYEFGESSGIPLGVSPGIEYPARSIPFPKGASLVLYSDIFWEDKGIPGISLLPERVPGLVRELNGESISKTIRQQLHYLGNLDLADDLTLIEITRTLEKELE